MAKTTKKHRENKKGEKPFSGMFSHDGRFADIQGGQKNDTTSIALDALVSIRLNDRERDSMLNAIDLHERLAGNPQQ